MRRSFFGWRPDSLIEPLCNGKVVARTLLLGGKSVLLKNAWRVCMPDIVARLSRRESSARRPGF